MDGDAGESHTRRVGVYGGNDQWSRLASGFIYQRDQQERLNESYMFAFHYVSITFTAVESKKRCLAAKSNSDIPLISARFYSELFQS